MATDYDAPRRNESEEPSEDSLEELKARRNEAQSAVVDIDEGDTAESFELPGADLSGEELTVKVIPKQADEFTCSVCFLVQHRSRLSPAQPQAVCRLAGRLRLRRLCLSHRRARAADRTRAGPAARWAISTGRTACRCATRRRSTSARSRSSCGWR